MSLNRSGPLTRKTALVATTQLRRTPFPRPTPQQTRRVPEQTRPERVAAPKAPRYTGPTVIVARLVDERDLHRCLICGAYATNRQHREGRGMGGRGRYDAERTNGSWWLFSICGMGNASGCHKEVDLDREASIANGWVIRRNGPDVDASCVPILCFDGWHLLTRDHKRVPCPPPEGWSE